MNGLSKWLIALYLAAIFAAGAVSGWVVAAKTAKGKMFMPPRWEEIQAHQRERLQSELSLTADQTNRIDRILDQSSKEMRSIHEKNMKRIWGEISNRNAQIIAVLTPEQQKRFEELEKERRESWRRKDSWRGKHGDRDRYRGPRGSDGTNRFDKGESKERPGPR